MRRTDDIQVIALAKGPERYVVLFSEWRTTEALQQIGRWAANPSLSLTWGDAANMSQRIREADA